MYITFFLLFLSFFAIFSFSPFCVIAMLPVVLFVFFIFYVFCSRCETGRQPAAKSGGGRRDGPEHCGQGATKHTPQGGHVSPSGESVAICQHAFDRYTQICEHRCCCFFSFFASFLRVSAAKAKASYVDAS